MRTKLHALILLTLVSLIGSTTPWGHAQGSQSPIKLSIAFTGDSQIGEEYWLATMAQNPSSTNIPQLRQTMQDLTQLGAPIKLGVILGDMVMGFMDDQGQALTIQLDAWQQVYQSLSHPPGMRLLPLPGNHEISVYELNAETPGTYAYNVWLKWIVQNGYDYYTGNGPKPVGSNPDKLVRNESKMTFSFDLNGIHFVVINTDTMSTEIDPATHLPYSGWIPINWIERDLAAAQRNREVSAIIMLGHRTIEPPSYDTAASEATILDSKTYPLASRLAAALRRYTKAKAYLCCHAHSWEAFRLQKGKGVWEIIAGNAGAPLDTPWQPDQGQYYGFTVLDIYDSGKMVVRAFGRALPPPPQLFFEDQPVAPLPATRRERIVISRRW